MILAGGKGTRLYELTRKDAKPAVHFGGKYRIIDYALSNCAHSGIDTVGVLAQYESISLSRYIGNGEKWGLNGIRSSTVTIAPRQTDSGSNWFIGTADAIYQNLEFIDSYNPENVLILSGDHIYRMDYAQMLETHLENNADLTISVIEVTLEEAKRFGILSADEDGRITAFVEKPAEPKSTLASMGIYIFNYKVLREALVNDAADENSDHDFGKNIIPTLLANNNRLFVHRFEGYWKDVGTIDSLWEANMDLINMMDEDFYASDKNYFRLFSEDTNSVPQYIGKKAKVTNSIVNQGAIILGQVDGSIISNEVFIEVGAVVKDSVIMPGVTVGRNAYVNKAIVANDLALPNDSRYNEEGEKVLLIHEGVVQ
ncbi:MAG: Glucose-1-phosphate adenylyltransferase [Tenericutes bacterium ADurb.Bin087]|nr:MAG: Glucose-1-phosphate adenylyltransferase [Tenericutes bacterium ADurb.Bin087]